MLSCDVENVTDILVRLTNQCVACDEKLAVGNHILKLRREAALSIRAQCLSHLQVRVGLALLNLNYYEEHKEWYPPARLG